MEQHTGSQYDDDLTVGIDEYDDSFKTGNVDLFEFANDEESPITRLKTLILSIDWEITDDILRQFNAELLDLKDIWADEKINLVYIQVLEKISKYIYKEKASANPNAIKLLLYFYSNLEKIVSTAFMPEEEKKRLLIEDVEMFEKFKKQLGRSQETTEPKKMAVAKTPTTAPAPRLDEPLTIDAETEDPLLNLKAIIFGMDWEINEAYLIDLGEEVRNLEKRFSKSKAKLIFLQGIGALGAYINLKRSNAHVDAFKLLHSFFLSLENIVRNGLTGDEEKRVLMTEVEKFNAFKSLIASTISPEAIAAEGVQDDDDISYPSAQDDITPAFADMPDDIHGFQEENEAESLGFEAKKKVDGQIERFFDSEKPSMAEAVGGDRMVGTNKNGLMDEMELRLDGFFGEDSTLKQTGETSEEFALKGVEVETEADDDTSEEALPRLGDEPAPALSENFEESSFAEPVDADQWGEIESPVDGDAQGTTSSGSGEIKTQEDISEALQGVEVETEDDDDSEEAPLPRKDEELAPALFSIDEAPEGGAEKDLFQEEGPLGIEGRLEDFFGDEPEYITGADGRIPAVGVGSEDQKELLAEDLPFDEDLAPALFSADEDKGVDAEEEGTAAALQEEVSGVDDFSAVALTEDSEPSATSSVDEEDVFVSQIDQDLDEKEIPADFEDHLKEFFETEKNGIETRDDQEVDLSDGLPESEAEAESKADAELEDSYFSADEGPVSDLTAGPEEEQEEPEEALTAPEETAGLEDVFEFEEPESDLTAGPEEEQEELEEALAAPEETAGIEDVFEFEEPESDLTAGPEEEQEEPEEALAAPEKTAGLEDVLEFEEPESDLTAGPEEEQEEPEEALAAPEEPTVAALKDEPSETLSVLQEDGDFIEYIEGVEFDSEGPETVFEPETEEVVFEAVDEERLSDKEDDVIFAGVEEAFDTYFAEQESLSDKAGEEPEEPDDHGGFSNIFGEGYEEDQELMGSEIRMEVFPEMPKIEEHVAAGLRATPAEDKTAEDKTESLIGGTETEREEGLFTGSELSFMEDNDPLSPLRSCIASLGLEINDSILESLFDEINILNNLWISNPVEKLFLQLLSTVALHIHDYRHEASPEAYNLLMSVFNKLEHSNLAGVDILEVQEDLLSETSKILLWQQKMLTRKATEQGDERETYLGGAGGGTGRSHFEPASLFEQDGQDPGISQKEREDDESSEPETRTWSSPDSLAEEKISRIVRDEVEMLRQTLRMEIADLLHQHLEREPSERNKDD